MKEQIQRAVNALKADKLIIMPGETGWEIAALPGSEKSLEQLKKAAVACEVNLICLLIAEENELYRYVQRIPALAWELIEYSEKPLTIIYSEAKQLPLQLKGVEGVAIRVVKDELSRSIIKMAGGALAVFSVKNKIAEEVTNHNEEIRNMIDYQVSVSKKVNHVSPVIVKVGEDGSVKFYNR